MTTERETILKLINDRKANGQSITLAELTNATGIFQYRKLEKILEGLKHDGYFSRLIIRDLDEPITYELTERGYNYQLEIDAEIQMAAAEKEAEQRRIAEAEEAKRQRKEEIRQQRAHNWHIAVFSSVAGGVMGFLTSLAFWLITK